jgi:Fe2+ or Zn2+ uptake regulation protein
MIVSRIVFNLQRKGNRITRTRKKIIEIFSGETKPISAKNLLKMLSTESKVNKTTVYREIEFLLRQNLIQQVFIDPKEIFYESTGLEHHHHFVCNNCGSLENVYLGRELEKTERKLELEKKFKIEKHSLEFFGLCANCK